MINRARGHQIRFCRQASTGLAIAGLIVAMVGTELPVYAQAVSAQAASIGAGYTQLSEGRVEGAIATFQRLVQQNPNSVEAQLGLAIAYRRAGREADALRTYQQVIALEPTNRLALNTLGLLGEFRPEWQPIGIQALTQLLQLESNSLEAKAQRAKLYYYQGQFSAALADYAQVLPRTSDPTILGPAAEAHTFSGDYAAGLALFERYRAAGGAIQGDRAIAYAQALRESGQLPQATQLLEQELRRSGHSDTQQIRLRGALASTYAANRQFQPALELIQPLRGRPDSRLTLARALNALGDYGQQAGYNQESASLYRQVLATSPNLSPGVRREASFALGNLPEHRPLALQLVEQLAQVQPGDASLTLQRQLLSYQLGQTSQANLVQQVRAAFPQLPADPVQVRYLGQLLSRQTPPVTDLLPLYQSLINGGATEPFLHFRVAQIFAQQGRLAEARAALTTYASTAAGSRDLETTQLLLADLERREGNLAQSAQRYQSLLNTFQAGPLRTGAMQGLAAVYQTQGQLPQAIALYDSLIAANPQAIAYPLGRAALAYQAGLISEAQATALLSQGMQQPGVMAALPELTSLAAALPPAAERAELYQTLLASDPGNPQLQLRSLQVLAATNPTQAQAQAAALVAANPAILDWYFVQGEIAQQTRAYDTARQSYQAVLQRQPNQQDALLALAGLEFELGNYRQADQLYQQTLAMNSQNATARTALAALNAVQGKPLAAIQQLQNWQQEQMALGQANPQVTRQIEQIQGGLLMQRGIQPPWERF
ncbi:tetratricopeptide repeat protein [Nodosilinea sp. E11]|uniref:tetratricopeptide repeat protein n=1 Tax=Nodosilinea sp. E11 TaxID=3037479 RepID=UPI002934CA1D|nr:tetratricopeptide repeat protein [Nodosilinea sp. E11]WOD38620.1 tetratricopeptide repeat protein [Nodosilinea sp. E11]